MAEKNPFKLTLVAINKYEQIKKLRSFGDRLADRVTEIAGSTLFLVLNIVWFTVWIVINRGTFGAHSIFDKFPFGLLTMVVSLEAIILAVFVLISQNRQAKRSEIRAELDYLTDLQSDAEISTIISILERLAEKQAIDVSDLLQDLALNQKKILKEHPITAKDLEV